jgi:uncharacterized lipoprotein YmbA|tara:strand:+ start:3120 stop:3281 length:162 start_codon:yes stop_codon:yes gene_type:complete
MINLPDAPENYQKFWANTINQVLRDKFGRDSFSQDASTFVAQQNAEAIGWFFG